MITRKACLNVESPDAVFLAREFGTRVKLYKLAEPGAECASFTMRNQVCAFCFSNDSRKLAILTGEGTLRIEDISDISNIRTLVQKGRRKPIQYIPSFNCMFFTHDNRHVIHLATNEFEGMIMDYDIQNDTRKVVYKNGKLIQSLKYSADMRKCTFSEYGVVSKDRGPARIMELDFSQIADNEIAIRLLFERDFKPNEKGIDICRINEEQIICSTETCVERYEYRNGQYMLTMKTPEFEAQGSGIARIDVHPYALLFPMYDGPKLLSLDDMQIIRSYAREALSADAFTMSRDGMTMYLPLQVEKLETGKILSVRTMEMRTSDFLDGCYDDELRLRKL